MAKHQTTAQIERERKAAAESRAEARRLQDVVFAKNVLRDLTALLQRLQSTNMRVLRHATEAIKDEIAYLIEESEHYRDAAAELFREQSTERQSYPEDAAGKDTCTDRT